MNISLKHEDKSSLIARTVKQCNRLSKKTADNIFVKEVRHLPSLCMLLWDMIR